MHQIVVGITQHLHLDMPSLAHQLFKIDLVIPKGSFGFPAAAGHHLGERTGLVDNAHASTTTTPGCLQHQWVTNLVGKLGDFCRIVGQSTSCRHY